MPRLFSVIFLTNISSSKDNCEIKGHPLEKSREKFYQEKGTWFVHSSIRIQLMVDYSDNMKGF